jgi:hypothetical protein
LSHAQADKPAKHADNEIGQGERPALRQAAGEVYSAEARKEHQYRVHNDLLIVSD